MNGAKWTTAKTKTKTWRPAWMWWRARKTPEADNITPVPVQRPLVLVGRFDDVQQFQRAAEAFAEFRPEEVQCIATDSGTGNGRSRLLQWMCAVIRLFSVTRPKTEVGRPVQLLSRTSGVVLVRSAARFGRACQIIEECGGSIGGMTADLS